MTTPTGKETLEEIRREHDFWKTCEPRIMFTGKQVDFLIGEVDKLLRENEELKKGYGKPTESWDLMFQKVCKENSQLLREREELIGALEHDKRCLDCAQISCGACRECGSTELLSRIKGGGK